ncbi:MAG: AAA family ATPase, partial [Limisphaerales bacterium]
EERLEILRVHIQRRGRDVSQFDLPGLVLASAGFSGAEIQEAVNSALYEAFYAREELGTRHVLSALNQTVPLARTMEEQITRLRAWAEGRARNASVARAATVEETRRKVEL